MNKAEIINAQKDELEALKSIFLNIQDLRECKKKEWKPLKLKITLTPQEGCDTAKDGRVDLIVNCCETYPNVVPNLSFNNVSGISKSQETELLKDLYKRADTLKGAEMIFELATYVREYLFKNSKPAPKSCYDEMTFRHQLEKQEKCKIEKQRMEEEKRKRDLYRQVHRRSREEHSSENSMSSSTTMYGENSQDSSGDLICEHETQVIRFGNLEIIRGQCKDHLPLVNCIIYTATLKENGQLYYLSQWTIDDVQDKHYLHREIEIVEQEMKTLLKLKHPNLIIDIHFASDIEGDNRIVMNLLSEFIIGTNCHALYLSKGIQVEIHMLRYISENTLSALDYLHQNNVVHKNLNAHCVYLSHKGEVKVCNQNLFQRLNDLSSDITTQKSYNKKTDIFKFGIMVLSLLTGSPVDEANPSIPFDIEETLSDFIQVCILKNEYRYPASKLLQHSFIKVDMNSPVRKVVKMPDHIFTDPADDKLIIPTTIASGQSRYHNDFTELECIGEGAYGQVFKVRNNLDRRNYAIKRILLNSNNKTINRKIIREVKLLSRLNHENVVRYYNSWIETALVDFDNASTDEEEESQSIFSTKPDSRLEDLIPNFKELSWSVKYNEPTEKMQEVEEESSDDDPSDEDEDDEAEDEGDELQEENSVNAKNQVDDENDDSIVFFVNSSSEDESSEDDDDDDEEEEEESKNAQTNKTKEMQIMYIQMEFCDRSTLDQVIDIKLYEDQTRLWSLFREIIEGLIYIHQQGTIHRDLKPCNIFIDGDGHVKIGDFGLATSNFMAKNDPSEKIEKGSDSGEPSGLTGQIGTALYAAPELSTTGKASYDKKVDIYSLGIIFFEMCYRRCGTKMERIDILKKLRLRTIEFPDDFDTYGKPAQKEIIKWLLNHKPIRRPSAQDLLDSDHIPPPVLQEREMRQMIRHTLKDSSQKAYKYLVEACLMQDVDSEQDVMYDRHIGSNFAETKLQKFNYVYDTVINVFKLHGGQALSTRLLMPKSKHYECIRSSVRLMTQSGFVVTIPYDLRVPFARYVVWNGITDLRRYAIGKVYRENRLSHLHPEELHECAFDIVTPTPDLIADAEVLLVLDEMAKAIIEAKVKNLIIKLNHKLLLQAILLHSGIQHTDPSFYGVLANAMKGKSSETRIQLNNLGIRKKAINTLLRYFSKQELMMHELHALFDSIIKKNTEASKCASMALGDLEKITENAKNLNVQIKIVIDLRLVLTNMAQYSGMICQLVLLKKGKHKHSEEKLAEGGRYDGLLQEFKSLPLATTTVKQSAVGVSISLEGLVKAFVAQEEVVQLDVIVGGCDGSASIIQDIGLILNDLRALGLPSIYTKETNLKELVRKGEESNVQHVIYKEKHMISHHFMKTKKLEKIKLGELKEYMQQIMKNSSDNCMDVGTSTSFTRLDSRNIEIQEANVYIQFLSSDGEKMTVNVKKRHESQIKQRMGEMYKKLTGDVTLFAMNLSGAVIASMACYFNFASEIDFNKSVDKIKEIHSEYKKNFAQHCKKIYDAKSKSNNPTIILYSISDNTFRVFL